MKRTQSRPWLAKTVVSLCCSVALLSSPAVANTITPSFFGFTPGVSITWGANLSSGELHAGDGFTIFDVGGFTGATVVDPNWTVSVAAFGSPWGIAPTGVDTALPNLTFTYTNGAIQSLAQTFLGFFTAGTTATTLVVDDWTSRDHFIGSPLAVGDGGVANSHTDEILVPAAVPEAGLTLSLLSIAFVGLEGLRRRLRIAK